LVEHAYKRNVGGKVDIFPGIAAAIAKPPSYQLIIVACSLLPPFPLSPSLPPWFMVIH